MSRAWVTRSWRVLVALSLIVVAGLASVPYAQAATTVTLDNGDVAGLIGAINAANGGTPQVINLFSGGSYVLSSQLPNISGDVIIHGNGATIERSSAAYFSVIKVTSGGSLTLVNATITGGYIFGFGGGIYNDYGTLTVSSSTITGNHSSLGGGGIYSLSGILSVSNSTITNNTSSGQPGSFIGGGIGIQGGSTTVDTVVNSTITNNTANYGGGVANSGATFTLANSIVASNYATLGGPDAYGSITDGGNNLIGAGGGSNGLTNTVNGNIVGSVASPIDPMLSALADNGGPTQTMALQSGSPAIGKGNSAVCSAAPVNGVDQRGYTRPASSCDIGAFELDGVAPAAITYPTLTVDQSSVTVDEGQTATNTGTVTNPNSDLASLSTSVGTVTNNGDGTWTWSFGTTDGPSQSQTVTISANYSSTGTISTTFDLIVNNVAPTVGAITDPSNSFAVGTAVNLTADFTDPGTADTHTAAWDWGDGSSSAGNVTESDGSGSVSGTHTYSAAGLYTVTLTVTDNDHASGQSVYQYLVVYDPNGGFVTGGGRISSPAGAYSADPTVTGKVSFGFVAKYHTGANVPVGDVQLQFQAAGLSFHSNSYQWLVISGSNAQLEGTGSLNGVGGYEFTLAASVGRGSGKQQADMFRIEITDPAGNVVYDNGPNTALSGGSIVIHH